MTISFVKSITLLQAAIVGRIIVAVLILATLLVPDIAEAGGLSGSQLHEMESGKVVMIKLDEDKGKGFIGGTSYALFPEDIDMAWKAIQDASLYMKLYPTTLESKTIYKKDDRYIVKMVQGNALVKATYYLNYKIDADDYTLSWKLNKSKPHDIDESRGIVQFKKWKDGRTFMKMSCVVDLGNAIIEKLFGDEIAMGLLRMPMKFRKFLKKPAAKKYAS